MELVDTLPETNKQDEHFLEKPLEALLTHGHVVFGQDDEQHAAMQQAAIFFNNQSPETKQALMEHPLIVKLVQNIETETGKDSYDLARTGWHKALTVISAAMLVKNQTIKELLGRIETKYLQ